MPWLSSRTGLIHLNDASATVDLYAKIAFGMVQKVNASMNQMNNQTNTSHLSSLSVCQADQENEENIIQRCSVLYYCGRVWFECESNYDVANLRKLQMNLQYWKINIYECPSIRYI